MIYSLCGGVKTMNFELLRAIRENGLRQRDFARLVGEHESVISRIISGTWNIDQIRKIKFAKVLGKKPEDLFSSSD
jgi:transcriptional regulator with XRE-family HTH domain